MNPRFIGIVVVMLALILAPGSAAQTGEQNREQDHEELRALLRTVTDAINTQDLDKLATVLHDSFSLTMVDQAHGTTIDQIKTYFRERFEDEGALIQSVRVEPSADILTEFISETVGVNYGTSVDTYTLKGGRTVVLNSRWTATTVKTDGGWKVSTVHAGVNMLDNPILTALEKVRYVWGAGGTVAGLFVGFGFAFMRRSR
jgi:ketosteroid isomerase-like protein